jgi:DNA-binding MarR family transcriptional regulator
MKTEAPDLISDEMQGWTPSPEAQHLMLWRVLHLLMARYGSIPLGQALVGITNTVLNEMGHAPTVTELCEATGLPKSSISRYISAQMEQGVVTEDIDPRDRRRRMLRQTDEGKKERQWMIREMRRIVSDLHDEDRERGGRPADPAVELQRMKAIAEDAPGEYHQRRRRGRRSAA